MTTHARLVQETRKMEVATPILIEKLKIVDTFANLIMIFKVFRSRGQVFGGFIAW